MMSPDMNSCMIYYLCGFICKVMSKDAKCTDCKVAFRSHDELSIFPVADLITNRTRGKLIYPSCYIFKLFSKIEEIFQLNINAMDGLLDKVLETIIQDKELFLPFPCKLHRASVIAKCIHYYVMTRMKQFARLSNRTGTNVTAILKKQAKVSDKKH